MSKVNLVIAKTMYSRGHKIKDLKNWLHLTEQQVKYIINKTKVNNE